MPEKTLKLYPLPAREKPGSTEIYKDLELPGSGRGDVSRPYVFINMVSSLDGNTSVKGKASGIGTAVDRRVMRTLRSKVDAVMIGAGTLRAEKLSLGLDAEDTGSNPLAVMLSSTGDIPLENLVRYKDQRVLILLSDRANEAASSQLNEHAEVLRVRTTASGSVDLASALEVLRSEYAVHRLLVEGGPTLNHALISACLADDLFITLAPRLLGTGDADAPAILDGPLNDPQNLKLLSAYVANDEFFLRYALTTTQTSEAGTS
jgi:2,5-diamino-6-(ribosylamino)-4(3H)-pyrimidinone 5'-phosphate reductase